MTGESGRGTRDAGRGGSPSPPGPSAPLPQFWERGSRSGDDELAPTRPATRVPRPDPGLPTLLLTLADDELVIGYWDTEWTGIAPILEEDVATSSIAQDEIGHALAFYGLLETLTGVEPDRWAYGREPEEYRFARLMGHARRDWTFSVARRFLYETADAVRLAALERSSHAPLAQLVAKMRREETYHQMHAQTWFERFAQGPDEGRARFAAALTVLLADAADMFAALDGEDELVADGTLPEPMDALRQRWLATIHPALERLRIIPNGMQSPAEARRGGKHPDFAWLHGEMTMVYRQEPGAEW